MDPYDQLDLARNITSMAIASRVSKLESEMERLRQKMYETRTSDRRLLTEFFTAFSKTVIPLFNFHRRSGSAECIVRIIAVFTSTRESNNLSLCDSFLEEFLWFFLVATNAASKTVGTANIIDELGGFDGWCKDIGVARSSEYLEVQSLANDF
ncbi:hypothetical protein F0562_032308 [Nyssa sinensis]|uniref:Uncharacterized protein n=1 Tax=Nyssa sinensis TaxID=561372 RepID=A0A5J5AME7_9ASTE|nr:hypothetical protein F0562_032308 [Nyssa sinensis]